jgi:preprotein translocase subunit SecA
VSSLITRPGAAFGIYPERIAFNKNWLEQTSSSALRLVRAALQPWEDKIVPAVAEIHYHSRRCEIASGPDIEEITEELRRQLRRDGQTDKIATAVFALVREVTSRELGQHHSDQHLACGWALFKGMLAEVEPGEDKSLAALLPACTAALAGVPVHIITGDDYLAERDAYRMRPVFTALGLTVGRVSKDMPLQHRCAAYRCDVTYGSGRQFATDYLQDRLLLQKSSGKLQQQVDRLNRQQPLGEQLRLQGLCYAIVDQAASTMIGETLTPLVLTDSNNAAQGTGGEPEILARISLPRFFQRYLKLCGMSGTLQELSGELRSVYDLDIYRVPLRHPSKRRFAPDQVFHDRVSKWQAILRQVLDRHHAGQPVLVGTRNKADAEHLSLLFTSAGVIHGILDAAHPSQSAAVQAGAGAPGSVTIATYKDGLGTDIALGDRARELGGMHVILSEHNDAAYIDRQFSQRCGRRGDPGSVVAMLSLEDELACKYLAPGVRERLKKSGQRVVAALLRFAQFRQEQNQAFARRNVLRADRHFDELLAFSGRKQ